MEAIRNQLDTHLTGKPSAKSLAEALLVDNNTDDGAGTEQLVAGAASTPVFHLSVTNCWPRVNGCVSQHGN